MKLSRLILVLTIAVFAFSACKKTSSELATAIPANASYVFHMDGKSMADKSNYDIFENMTVQRGLNLAKAMLGNKEAVEMLDGISKDINASGLNLKGDIYMYVDYPLMGLVIGVNNAEKVEKLVSLTGSEVENNNGIYSWGMDRSSYVTWDKEKFLLLINTEYYSETDLPAAGQKQLAQTEKESVLSKDNFKKFIDEKKDISVYYSLGDISSMANEYLNGGEEEEIMMNILKELQGVTSISSISFDKGKISLESKNYYDSEETKNKMTELAKSSVGELNGDLLKYIAEKPIIYGAVNVKGEGIYNILSKFGIMQMIEEELEDLQEENPEFSIASFIRSMEGDFVASFNNMSKEELDYYYDYNPDASVFMTMKNDFDFNSLPKMLFEDFEEVETNVYMINENNPYYFGFINNTLFFTTSSAAYEAFRTGKEINNILTARAKGHASIIGGNLGNLKPLATDEYMDDEQVAIIHGIIDLFDDYEMTGETDSTGKGQIQMTNQNQNSLATIMQYCDGLLNMANDYIGF